MTRTSATREGQPPNHRYWPEMRGGGPGERGAAGRGRPCSACIADPRSASIGTKRARPRGRLEGDRATTNTRVPRCVPRARPSSGDEGGGGEDQPEGTGFAGLGELRLLGPTDCRGCMSTLLASTGARGRARFTRKRSAADRPDLMTRFEHRGVTTESAPALIRL